MTLREALARAGSMAALGMRLRGDVSPVLCVSGTITDEAIDRAIEEAFESCRA